MALNLLREAKLYASVATLGAGPTYNATFSTSNTWKVNVLSGFSFSQTTANQEITVTEAGPIPLRGKKVFNTAMNPVDISFSTYIRPYLSSGSPVCIERIMWEALVGNGITRDGTINLNSGRTFVQDWGNTKVLSAATPKYMQIDFEGSNVHQLLKLNMYFAFENTTYLIREVVVNSAEVSFDITGIATVAWTAQGKDIIELVDSTSANDPHKGSAGVNYVDAPTTASFIANKLSIMSLTDYMTGVTHGTDLINYDTGLQGSAAATSLDATNNKFTIAVDGASPVTVNIVPPNPNTWVVNDVITALNDAVEGANFELTTAGDILITSATAGSTSEIDIVDDITDPFFDSLGGTFTETPTAGTGTPKTYDVAITGGSLRLENNITFLTPDELGILNKPITHFTGNRSISGTLNCYLNTGNTASGGLLKDLASSQSADSTEFELVFKLGGLNGGTNPTVYFHMPHAHIGIPNIQSEDVLSLSIEFSGLGQSLSHNDEIYVKYYPV